MVGERKWLFFKTQSYDEILNTGVSPAENNLAQSAIILYEDLPFIIL